MVEPAIAPGVDTVATDLATAPLYWATGKVVGIREASDIADFSQDAGYDYRTYAIQV